MNVNTVPTKGNLILAKNSLALARQGFDLMDKKRNILIHELIDIRLDEASSIQNEIDVTFHSAYKALQTVNIEMGIKNVELLSSTVPIEDSISIKYRSIMGTEIPIVTAKNSINTPSYAFYDTRMSLDRATKEFAKVKELTIRLSSIENAAYRLANSIKKTQKRANALQNITIPLYTELTFSIQNALEERNGKSLHD